jgi:predicted transcriptional regulator
VEIAMTKSIQLGDLQLAIMRFLWQLGEASVTDVHRGLFAERQLAPTTIATMLRKMEEKGVVVHRTEGRKFIYRPTISEEGTRRSMVEQLTDRLFSGNVAQLVSHLLEEHDVDARELDELKRLIEDKGRDE